jgi:hypothetical protein
LPLNEETLTSIISSIEQKFPKVTKKQFSLDKIAKKAHLNVPEEYKKDTLTFFTNTRQPSVLTKWI